MLLIYLQYIKLNTSFHVKLSSFLECIYTAPNFEMQHYEINVSHTKLK